MNNIYSDLTTELMRPILVSSSMATDTFLKDWAIDGERDSGKVTPLPGSDPQEVWIFHRLFHLGQIRKLLSLQRNPQDNPAVGRP